MREEGGKEGVATVTTYSFHRLESVEEQEKNVKLIQKMCRAQLNTFQIKK